ncbi:MAG: hypothetical protein AAGD10_15765 [Myxococcota bacterium]
MSCACDHVLAELRLPPSDGALSWPMRGALAFGLAACASSTSGMGAAPDWVRSGSGVRAELIVGVGSSEGINNPALARTAAATRARAEISRILQTYSQSLMKDYQASELGTGESQRVEQLIRSFSATVQRGVEIVDYWVDGKRTWALARLDLDRGQFEAADPDITRWWGARADGVWAELEAEMGQMAGVAASARKPASKAWAAEGAWVDGACPATFLCGVGTGVDRASADAAARAELARLFEARVQATQASYEEANRRVHSALGEDWVEVQKVSEKSLVSTQKLVRFSRIEARQALPDGRRAALAVIERGPASRTLQREIRALDEDIEGALSRAEGAEDDLRRHRALRRAMTALAEREVLDGDLQVISGLGLPAPVARSQIEAQLRRTTARLPFRVVVEGPSAARVQGCLEDALTERGYELQRERAVLEVRGRLEAEQEGEIRGQAIVRTLLELSLTDLRSNERFATVQGTEKATRPSFERSVSTAAFKLCRDQVPEMLRQIEARF